MLVALAALLALAGVLSSCGDGVPGNAVARVGDDVIKQSTFTHWLGVAAHSSRSPGATGPVVVPDPPKFVNCITAKRQTVKPTKGQPAPTDAQLAAQCNQEYSGERDQVMQFLIQNRWIMGEARDLGISVSDADVKKAFERQKKQSFPTDAQYQAFLKSTGMTQADIDDRVKQGLLTTKIRNKVTKGKDKVTEAQIADYYNKNKQRFSQPERRSLNVVLTRSRARALQALGALRARQSFASVAKRYSVDQASKAQGGKLPDVTPGQQEKNFDAAIFRAPKGKVLGPVKTQFGYYVFQVTKVVPASQQSLDQARPTIKQLLAQQGQQKAITSFVKDFQKKWKDQTNCRKGFVIQLCKNAPKPKTTSTVPPGAVPQQGAPQSGGAQQAPQQQVPQQRQAPSYGR
jgi:foldase protein PrsA